MHQFQVLATDYDGTLATDGHVPAPIVQALVRLRASGVKLALVTGRELTELRTVFPRFDVFDAIVAENGAELYWPAEDRSEILGDPPSTAFLAEMQQLDVAPYSVGKVVFATWRPHEAVVADAIARLGLDYQIVFNKRAVMVLPKGIDKFSGLAAALKHWSIEPARVVGIGDAENDLPFLRSCGLAAAVDNALPAVKRQCQFVAKRDHGDGVVELVEALEQGRLDVLAGSLRAMGGGAKSSR